MQLLLAIVVGIVFASGLYLTLRRSIVKLIIGLALLSHAANLLVFTAGGLTRAQAPLVAEGATAPETPHADPVPQALILTAIVISFGVIAFTMVLASRVYRVAGSDDTDSFKESDA